MKRTSFLLASLTAIALLSCSQFDNSNSPAEDVSYPQSPALQKVSLGNTMQSLSLQNVSQGNVVQGSSNPGQSTINTNGTKCVSCGSMSISGIPYNGTGWSSDAICNFTNLPSNSWNISYQFTGSGPTGSGTFSPQFVEIICGNWWGDFTPMSYANIYTTAFAGTPANVKCYLAFYGKCYGTATGGGPCSYSISNIQGCQEYTY